MATLLLFNLAGAAACAFAVVFMLRGRTRLPAGAVGVIAVVLFFALGNLLNRVVLPAVFGDPLAEVLAHRRPTLSIFGMALVSFALALVLTLVAGGLVRLFTSALEAITSGRARREPALDHPQRVGQPCAACGERIVMDPLATSCVRCGAILHLACADRHHCAPDAAPG